MHSHLLPGIDDGVQTPEQALLCLEQLQGWGIQKVITTPHVSRDYYPNTTETLLKGQDRLQNLVIEHNLPLTVEVAAEYMLDDFFPDLIANNDLLSFGAERYVLFETGFEANSLGLETVIFRLQTKGYTPVLAHPERYAYFHKHRDMLPRLREMGCLFQLNWLSVTGLYGERVKKQARLMLEQKSIDFVGSDLHGPSLSGRFQGVFSAPDFALFAQQPLRNASLLTDVGWPVG